MKLSDLSPLMARRHDGGLSYDRLRAAPELASLAWPDDVLEQFLFDHGDNAAFVHDYGSIDLRDVTWRLEQIPAADCNTTPTGASNAGCIESYAENPVHWVTVRPPEVRRHWDEYGTWLRPPLLIDRHLLAPGSSGLQVLEGAEPASASCAAASARNCTSPPSTRLGSGALKSALPNDLTDVVPPTTEVCRLSSGGDGS
jgi:hypothetical protein